jgi:hypothetical protein
MSDKTESSAGRVSLDGLLLALQRLDRLPPLTGGYTLAGMKSSDCSPTSRVRRHSKWGSGIPLQGVRSLGTGPLCRP